MNAPQALVMYLCFFALFIIATCVASVDNVHSTSNKEDQKLEIFDGVYMGFPRDNSSGRLLSFEFDTDRSLSEGRGKSKKLMKKILPLLAIPFILQSVMTPFVLGFLKFMLIKSFLVGKLALSLIMFNAFKNNNSFKGRDAEIANAHYGYQANGLEHYTTYLNR